MMMKKNWILYLFGILLFTQCVEEVPLEDNSFQRFLVVESLLTNELKQHQVRLSATFPVDTLINAAERNATVTIRDDQQNSYAFQEIEQGLYQSIVAFQAEIGRKYTLEITTSDGKTYASSEEQIPGINDIDEIELSTRTNLDGFTGVSVNVISSETNQDAQYFRYEFEETYRVVVPKWSEAILEPVSTTPPFSVQLVPKTINDRVCYTSTVSNEIILFDSAGLSENTVTAEVQFLAQNNFKIAHRYSILVKQYAHSFEAHTFFTTLDRLSSNGSIFTNVQPGLLTGNIASTSDPDDRALGYFEIASASEQRIFFNYEDFFDLTNDPVFIDNCEEFAPPLTDDRNPFVSPLINALESGAWIYFDANAEPQDGEGPYLLVRPICGDCRELGSLTPPDFWVD
jgi:hypothetical protein